MKYNIGCGRKKMEGYINTDNQEYCKPDILDDIRYSTIASDSAEEIICDNSLEHIEKEYLPQTIDHLIRILKIGGKLIITLPEGHLLKLHFRGQEIVDTINSLIQIKIPYLVKVESTPCSIFVPESVITYPEESVDRLDWYINGTNQEFRIKNPKSNAERDWCMRRAVRILFTGGEE